jgi:hypothetical protein
MTCRIMAFAFHITADSDNQRKLILHLCEKYNPGYTVIRDEVRRLKNGRVAYTVDVYDPTPYGMELHDWLQRGKKYDKERRTNPHFPHGLHGPVWCIDYPSPNHGSWWLKITRPLPRHT